MGGTTRVAATAAAGALVALLAVGGGLALADRTPVAIGADGTITACAKGRDGRARLVGAASDCRKGERAVTWNREGPAGPPGPPGPPGPAGEAPAAPGDVVAGTMTIGTGAAIPIHAFSIGAEATTTFSGGGTAVGKPKPHDAVILKDLDATTPELLKAIATGRLLANPVVIVIYDPGTTTPLATYRLEGVFVTGTEQTAGADALEELHLAYEVLRLDVGAAGVEWDIPAGRAS